MIYNLALSQEKSKLNQIEKLRIAAETAIKNRKYEKAIDSYKRLLKFYPLSYSINIKISKLYHDKLGDSELALLHLNKALLIAEKEHYLELQSGIHFQIARIYESMNNLKKSKEHDKKALDLLIEEKDKNALVVKRHFIKGKNLYKKEKYDNALVEYQKALKLNENALNKKNLDLFLNYEIGKVYYSLSQYEKSNKILMATLKFCEKEFGKDHLFIAHICVSLASNYLNQYFFDTSEAYYLRALKIYRKSKDNTVYLADLNWHLATLYNRMGQYEQAIEFYKKAKNIAMKIDDKKLVTKIDSHIASVYLTQGKYQLAKQLINKGLSDASIPEKSTFKAYLHLNLAYLYDQLDNQAKSKEEIQKAFDIFKNIYGEKGKDLAVVYKQLGTYYFKQKKFKKALAHALKAVQIVYPDNHQYKPEFILSPGYNSDIGLYYLGLKQYDKAFPYLKKAVESSEKIYGSYHKNTARIYYNIGTYYYQKKEYIQAKMTLKKSYEYYKRNKLFHLPLAKETLALLSDTYGKLNDHEKAKKYFDLIPKEKGSTKDVSVQDKIEKKH